MAQTISEPSSEDRVPRLRRLGRQLPWPLNLYQTAVGKKYVMALTGIALLGYVVVHMIGNLHLYEGPTQIHEYAEALRDLGGHLVPRTLVLWLMRIGLIGAFVLHIHSAYSLRRMIAASNPDTGFIAGNKRYPGGQDFIAANYASRTMFWTGNIVLLYIAFHLGDLTWGWWLGDEYVRGDVYHNVVESMSSLPIAIIYVVANVALAIHIYHGAWSLFQSLGINNPRFNGALRAFATGISVLILVGNLSFPIAVQTGLLDEDGCDGSCLPIDEDQDQDESAGGS